MPSKTKGRAAVARKANALERLEVEYVPIESIRPNAYNPNRQAKADFELLLRSMTEDGFDQPIVVQRETREIVDGEHRWRAARELGMTEIPVVFVDMDEAQMRLSTLRHNRARGSEDQDLTAALFRDLRDLGSLEAAQSALGIPSSELERILDDTPAPAALAGEEFGQAWEPTGIGYARGENVLGDRPRMESATPAALAILEAGNAAAAGAATEDERVAFLSARDLFRLNYTYTAAEGDVIRLALGDHPATSLVEMCRARDQVPA